MYRTREPFDGSTCNLNKNIRKFVPDKKTNTGSWRASAGIYQGHNAVSICKFIVALVGIQKLDHLQPPNFQLHQDCRRESMKPTRWTMNYPQNAIGLWWLPDTGSRPSLVLLGYSAKGQERQDIWEIPEANLEFSGKPMSCSVTQHCRQLTTPENQ